MLRLESVEATFWEMGWDFVLDLLVVRERFHEKQAEKKTMTKSPDVRPGV